MRKRILRYTSILVVAVMMLATASPFPLVASASIWDGTVATNFESGDGTEANPYVIKNGAQLAYFASIINAGDKMVGKYIALGDDIKLNDTTNVAQWQTTAPANAWKTIGNSSKGFSGVFDGKGYTVSGVYHKGDISYVGFFGNASNAVIKNLNIAESSIQGKKYVAILAGIASKVTISNCTVNGYLYAGDNADIISDAGGIAGRAKDCTIEYCVNYGEIFTKSRYVGGIVGTAGGSNGGTTISKCVNKGKVTATGLMAGGIAGVLGADSGPASIENCYNIGEISGSDHVGGIAARAGGVVGGAVTNCYNIGLLKVTAAEAQAVGAIAGNIFTATPVTNCYYSLESYAVGVGKDDASTDLSTVKAYALDAMKGTGAVATFGFDSTIWKDTINTPELAFLVVDDLIFSYPTGSYIAGTKLLIDGVDFTASAKFYLYRFNLPSGQITTKATVQLLVPYTTANGTEYHNHVYFVSKTGENLTIQYHEKLTDLLCYVGVAIRTDATLGQGLRFKSTINKAVRNGGDYTVIEYGTLAKRTDNANELSYIDESNSEPLKIGKGKAYDSKLLINNEFAQTESHIEFTSVLIGIAADNYKTGYTFRSYCLVESNGQIYCVYGQTVDRSIYDIATLIKADEQYFNTFTQEGKDYINAILG